VPTKKIPETRRALLLELESMIGNSCYNKNIQNWGPGGEWKGAGRKFRYPITFVNGSDQEIKRHNTFSSEITDAMLGNGYYAFGSNELHVMEALIKILDFLEEEYGVNFEKSGLET